MKTFCYYFLFDEYSKLIKQEKKIKNNNVNKTKKDLKTTKKKIDPFYLNYLHNFFIIY